ncbi:glutamine-binding protein of glutamine ABC transporter [Crocosphaera subtropica ATCC 51142]|uniref:Glutamine-binding protein of glutamine ABC transporter n=1 Tax=Crocosphaera subtropica (strain ATCC 51142 / BH68) TaxID=43989 RepID=B1WVD5_CROS5|nr:transporter substrate-binding domain-containing protein [Crocosphaera subtropica]ACB53925.1 glutamine-binding protein of glutamine ABC transporter [Crocosphaera subtropica ATCC 51142]
MLNALTRKLVSMLIIGVIFNLGNSNLIAATLEEIKQRGKLIVAVKDNVRPLGFRNQNNQLQGLEIDLAKQLAQDILGDPQAIILQPVQNQERLQKVIDGEVDLAIARITINSSRGRLVNFSPYYYLDGTGIITNNPRIRAVDHLSQGKIALLKRSSTIAVIRAELPQAELIGVNSYQEALTLLETEQVDAFAADNSVLAGWVQAYPQYYQLPVRLSGEGLGVVMPKGLQYASLRSRVNEAIGRWKASGWLANRLKYWGLP